VSTEITDRRSKQARTGGWILFDGECALCRRSVEFWRDTFERRGFEFEALQTAWVRETLGLGDAELLREMRVKLRDGRVFGGAEAIVELARHVWWARPLVWLARVPAVKRLLRAIYRGIAARRNCEGAACEMAAHGSREMK
jgi:predicted DCC family thiol-disulfide oxidoreductase YuxK